MSEKDDEHWISALAGDLPPAGAPATLAEAHAIREAMRRPPDEENIQGVDVEAGLQRLLFRLRQEGLAGDASRTSLRRRVFVPLAVAASVLVATGIVVLQEPTTDDRFVYRESPGGTQVLLTADPAKLGAEIAAELRALGADPSVIEFGPKVTVQVNWPEKPDEKHERFLKRYRLKQPDAPGLRIEIGRRE
jgi:hypothetical protein